MIYFCNISQIYYWRVLKKISGVYFDSNSGQFKHRRSGENATWDEPWAHSSMQFLTQAEGPHQSMDTGCHQQSRIGKDCHCVKFQRSPVRLKRSKMLVSSTHLHTAMFWCPPLSSWDLSGEKLNQPSTGSTPLLQGVRGLEMSPVLHCFMCFPP